MLNVVTKLKVCVQLFQSPHKKDAGDAESAEAGGVVAAVEAVPSTRVLPDPNAQDDASSVLSKPPAITAEQSDDEAMQTTKREYDSSRTLLQNTEKGICQSLIPRDALPICAEV